MNNIIRVSLVVVFVVCAFVTTRVFADFEVETDKISESPTPTATQTTSMKTTPAPSVTVVPAATPVLLGQPSPSPVPTAVPTPVMVQGFLKMKDIYQAGINSYKEQDFAQAIIYLKKALTHKDPYTKKYYYAEASAMLGVIYQFNIINKKLAYQYYRAALDVDPTTETALKHIGEVSDVKIAPKKSKKAEKHKAKKKTKKKKTKVRKTNEDF